MNAKRLWSLLLVCCCLTGVMYLFGILFPSSEEQNINVADDDQSLNVADEHQSINVVDELNEWGDKTGDSIIILTTKKGKYKDNNRTKDIYVELALYPSKNEATIGFYDLEGNAFNINSIDSVKYRRSDKSTYTPYKRKTFGNGFLIEDSEGYKKYNDSDYSRLVFDLLASDSIRFLIGSSVDSSTIDFTIEYNKKYLNQLLKDNNAGFYRDYDRNIQVVVDLERCNYYGDLEVSVENLTSIGASAFRGCTGLTKITISEGVTSIGDGAFYGCTGLTEITIPESVTSIGEDAFRDCTGLTEIAIPEGVTSIGNGAFYGCTGLTEITIPEGVTSIGREAFRYCTGLTEITIPESVTSIGNGAFFHCTGLTEITIPESVTSIGDFAFFGCKKVIVPWKIGKKPSNVSIDYYWDSGIGTIFYNGGK